MDSENAKDDVFSLPHERRKSLSDEPLPEGTGAPEPQAESMNLDYYHKQLVRDLIDRSIPSTNLRLRRWFNAFLKCNSIAAIAETANTTKQNLQKRFQLIIKEVQRRLYKDLPAGQKAKLENQAREITPLKFKRLVQ